MNFLTCTPYHWLFWCATYPIKSSSLCTAWLLIKNPLPFQPIWDNFSISVVLPSSSNRWVFQRIRTTILGYQSFSVWNQESWYKSGFALRNRFRWNDLSDTPFSLTKVHLKAVLSLDLLILNMRPDQMHLDQIYMSSDCTYQGFVNIP